MKSHQLINQTSGEQEYFTPMSIVVAAERVMGSIDLDPASCELANQRIHAGKFFTKKEDGLSKEWFKNVFINHPFGRKENPLWVRKMVYEYNRMEVNTIICITFAATSEEWFQPLMEFQQCFLTPRTNFYLPDGTLKRGVSKGSVVTYMGPSLDRFATEFKAMGTIKIRYGIA